MTTLIFSAKIPIHINFILATLRIRKCFVAWNITVSLSAYYWSCIKCGAVVLKLSRARIHGLVVIGSRDQLCSRYPSDLAARPPSSPVILVCVFTAFYKTSHWLRKSIFIVAARPAASCGATSVCNCGAWAAILFCVGAQNSRHFVFLLKIF